jgi:hypothetical protein
VGRDVVYGLLDIQGPGSIVQPHVEIYALLSAGVDRLAARLHLDAADVMTVHALNRNGYVRQHRCAVGVVEEIGEPVLKGVTRVAVALLSSL